MRKRIYKTVAVLIAATMLLCDNSIISLAEETDTETVEEVINEGEPEEEIIEEEKTEEEIIEEEKPEEKIIEEEPTEEVIEEEPTEEEPTEEINEEEPSEEESTERIIEEEKPEGEIIGEEPTEEAPTEEEPTEEEHPVEEVTTEEIMGVTFKSNDIAHGVNGDMAWAIDCDGNFVAKGQIASVIDKSRSPYNTPWYDYASKITSADFAVVSNDYSWCFERCENMTDVKLDFGDYDAQNVTDISGMFWACNSLETIDLSGLNTSKVEYMHQMFDGCTSLTALDISSFDVSSLISAAGMFDGCEKLENLNLGAFEAKKLTHFSEMFRNCKALKQIDLSKCTYSGLKNSYINWGDGYYVDLVSTFEGCSNLESVDLSGLSNCNIFDFSRCFYGCTSLKSVKFGKNIYMKGCATCTTFTDCSSLEEIDLSGFTSFSSMDDSWSANFKGCTSLKKLITPQWLWNGDLYLPNTGTWYRNDTGEIITRFTGFSDEYSVVLTRDELLKKENTYSISYKLNYGVNNPENPALYNAGEKVKLKDPTRNGYKFAGWYVYDADNKATKVTEISDGDFTVVAEWEAKTYSLKYVLNGGSFPKDAQHPSTYSADDLEFWLFLAPKRKGYTFEGWYLDAEYKDYVEWIGDIEFKNYTFYAKWAPVSYTARFHDGLESNQTVDEEFFYGKKKALLASKDVEFVNNGYYVSAWTAKINGKNKKFKAGEKVTNLTEKDGEVIDFYPVWSEITYTVTYKANGGKGSVKKQTVKGLKEFNLRKNSFTRKGYTANGWVDEEGHEYASGQAGVSNLTNTNKANIVLNAVWVENEYTLRLCPGKGVLPEGKDDYETLTAKYSDMILLPGNIYTREGYHFSGWNTKENGKGTTYGPGSSVSKLTATNLKEVKLYPVWKKNNDKAYVIIYDANGGTGKMTETVMKKTTKLKANAYKKAGYKFAGWQDAEGNIYSNKAQIKWSKELKGQILELTAVWESTEKR